MNGRVLLSEDHSAYRLFTVEEIKNLVVEGQVEPYEIFSDHFALLTK